MESTNSKFSKPFILIGNGVLGIFKETLHLRLSPSQWSVRFETRNYPEETPSRLETLGPVGTLLRSKVEHWLNWWRDLFRLRVIGDSRFSSLREGVLVVDRQTRRQTSRQTDVQMKQMIDQKTTRDHSLQRHKNRHGEQSRP